MKAKTRLWWCPDERLPKLRSAGSSAHPECADGRSILPGVRQHLMPNLYPKKLCAEDEANIPPRFQKKAWRKNYD